METQFVINSIQRASIPTGKPDADAAETPHFMISQSVVRANFLRFNSAFPGSAIFYAVKANSELEILKTLHTVGSNFEAASSFELELLATLSIPPHRIAYGSAVKPASHIRRFFEYGVRLYAFDSLTELEKLAVEAPGSTVYLRTTADDSSSVFRFSEKFGADLGEIVDLFRTAVNLGLEPRGLSFHVGSQSTEADAWAAAIRGLRPTIDKLAELDMPVEFLNIGGGFPIQYDGPPIVPDLEYIADRVRREIVTHASPPRVMMEPGRALVANAAQLVCSVISRIERRGRTWLFLDAGVYNGLFETMAYQGSTRYRVTSHSSRAGAPQMSFSIAGPTGDSPDVIARDISLPSNISVGDRLTVHDVGAYSLVCACPFNGFPRPNVIYERSEPNIA